MLSVVVIPPAPVSVILIPPELVELEIEIPEPLVTLNPKASPLSLITTPRGTILAGDPKPNGKSIPVSPLAAAPEQV